MTDDPRIKSAETMIRTIRDFGIIPFFRGKIPGWSVEEQTDPDFWFTSSEELGPWDWKIDTVREGNVAYGKFIGNKAAFSTVGWYAHLMNWRRSLPKYRIPLDEDYPGDTLMDRLYKVLSPTLLKAIREAGAIEPADMRQLLQERTGEEQLMSIGGSMNKYLFPKIKRAAVGFLNTYLEMGTWTVVGDFLRIYRGRNREYTGWQRSSITTPELLFDYAGCADALSVDCTPEESLEILIGHISSITGCADTALIRKSIE